MPTQFLNKFDEAHLPTVNLPNSRLPKVPDSWLFPSTGNYMPILHKKGEILQCVNYKINALRESKNVHLSMSFEGSLESFEEPSTTSSWARNSGTDINLSSSFFRFTKRDGISSALVTTIAPLIVLRDCALNNALFALPATISLNSLKYLQPLQIH